MSELTWLGIFAWVVLYHVSGGLWRWYSIASARQNLFEIQDQLFIEAMSYTSEADQEAAREVRRVINSLIRYAHRVSILSVIAYKLNPELIQYGEERTTNRNMLIQQSTRAEYFEEVLDRVVVEINNILLHRSLMLFVVLHIVTVAYSILRMLEHAFTHHISRKPYQWKAAFKGFSAAVPSIAEMDSLSTRYS